MKNIKINKKGDLGAKMKELGQIKFIIEFIIALTLGLSAIIILFKIIFNKFDKNKNGKIEKEELTTADIEFCKELLKESIKTIAIGIYQQSGLTSKQINNMLLSEVKKAKNIIDETIKIEKEKENNEKN